MGLGKDYLFEWDEAIYGQLGVELNTNHDFLTPHWNQESWLEKPPAIAWVTALGQNLVEDLELGSRLFMPLFAALTLYAILQIGNHLGGSILAVTSIAMLGFFNLFLSRARVVNTDGMLLAAISWLIWLTLKGSSPWKVALVAALAILAKGPAGLLAILIATPLLFSQSKNYVLRTMYYVLIFTLPWHLYQFIVNGSEFYTPYLLEQVLRRATVPIEFHLESRWFYFVSLYKDLGVGVLLVAGMGLLFSLKNNFLFATWALLPLIIFTLAKTRLSWYILPSYPAVALLVGNALSFFVKDKKSQGLLSILVVGMLLQMLLHSYQFVAPVRPASPNPPHIQVALYLASTPTQEVAFLVSSSERVAEAILPVEQKISSSFRYGGAPSMVFYSGKKVHYYYNYDLFTSDIQNDKYTVAIITKADRDKLPPHWTLAYESGDYQVFTSGGLYANR